jgi:hypothetical protein
MVIDREPSEAIARRYFGTSQPLELLGGGVGGWVFLSPDARRAVKVHRFREGFKRELYVYRLLRRFKVNRLHGLNIPQFRGRSESDMLIAMDVVKAPFLLDFAGVLLKRPDFSEEVMAHWQSEIQERFGPNAFIAYKVDDSLQRYGLYYVDFRTTNLKLDGLPGLLPTAPVDSDDAF